MGVQNTFSLKEMLENAGLDAITAGIAKYLDIATLLDQAEATLGAKIVNYMRAFVELATANASVQLIEIEAGMRKQFNFKTLLIDVTAIILADTVSFEMNSNSNTNTDLKTNTEIFEKHAIKGLIKLGAGVMIDKDNPMMTFAKFLGDQAAMVANVGIHAKTKPVDYMATPQASPNDILYPQQTSFCKIPKAKQMTVANDDQYDLYKAYRSTTKIAQNEMFEASLSAKVANHSNWQAKLDQELYTHQHSAS